MILKHFYFQLLKRIALILANSIAIAFVVTAYFDALIFLNLVALLALQVWLLIRVVNHTNLTLAGFFESLEMEDMMLAYKGKNRSHSIDMINSSLSKICEQVKEARSAEAEKSQYLRAVTDHANVGLIAIDGKGKVELFNRAAADITGIISPSSINDIEKKNREIAAHIRNARPAEQKVIKLESNNELVPLSLRTSEIKFRDRLIKLVSLQNIRREMEEKETESWRNLIRILTHEIMNSVGPVISSIDTISGLLSDENTGKPKNPPELNEGIISDTIKGMEIVKEKSVGLKEFVSNFRSLTVLPEPNFEEFIIEELFEELKFLIQDTIRSNNIVLETAVYPKNLSLSADRNMIMQVLINLLNNAAEALEGKDKKRIEIKSYSGHNGRCIISVSDNGAGIPPEMQEKIFIPFFTTKEKGSGIGLSLSRQIMNQHGGTITIQSGTGKKTVFNLVF